MTEVVAHLLEEAEQLSIDERTELAERLVERLAHDIPHEIAQAQMREVHRRIAQVEAGEVTLIPGDEALERVRQLVASYQSAG
jgi:putative addiction module component (TIGR02574 family)